MNGAVNRGTGSSDCSLSPLPAKPTPASCAAATMTTQERRRACRAAAEAGLADLARSCAEKSPRQSRGQVTRRLITRLGEVIGADGALIERHRQSPAALAPHMICSPNLTLSGTDLHVTTN